MNTLDSLFTWLTVTTVRGSLLVLAVLVTQFALRRMISPQWRFALWFPVLVVLIAPHLPESRWSADNLRYSNLVNWAFSRLATLPQREEMPIILDVGAEIHPVSLEVQSAPASVEANGMGWRSLVMIGWVIGAAGMVAISLTAYACTWRRMTQGEVSSGTEVKELLAEAAVACGLRHIPRLLLSRAVPSPAVAGVLRPTLLLPAEFPSAFTQDEARLVLMHELIHLKRYDLAANWLLCLAQALHWFNPLLWFVFHRIRADREAACDAQVLALTRHDCRADYGHALLKLEGTLAPAGWSLGFVGIFERDSGIHSRIRAIASHRRTHPATSVFGAVLLATLTLVGATRAQEETAKKEAGRSPAEATNAAAVDTAEKTRVLRKLETIVIPRLEFREATIREALAFLKQKGVELDSNESEQSHRGVNMVLKLDIPGGSKLGGGEVAVNPDEARITVSLRNIPLGEALRYVTGLSNLKYRIKPTGVEVVSMKAPEPFQTKEWTTRLEAGFRPGVDPKTLLLARGISFPDGATASLSPDGTRLTMHNTPENLDLVDALLNPVPPPNMADMTRKLTSLIIPRMLLRETTLRETLDFLRKKSVELDTEEKEPAKRGVNIVLKVPPRVPTVPEAEPIPRSPAPEEDVLERKLILSLNQVPLGEALRYVAQLADLQLEIGPHSVAMVPKGASENAVVTREWILTDAMISAIGADRNPHVVTNYLVKQGVTFPRGTSAIWRPTSRQLEVRNTQKNIDLVERILASLSGEPTANAAQSRAEALLLPLISLKGATLREAIEFLRRKSVEVDPEKEGVNIILDLEGARQETKITLSLTNASVWDALRQVARIADVQLTAEARAVRIHQPGSMETR